MKHSILVALNDSIISNSVIHYLGNLGLNPTKQQITLLHVMLRPKAEQALMGKRFSAEQQQRMLDCLESARRKLIEFGFPDENVRSVLLTDEYTTVADGIIDYFNRESFDMVIIGRKKKSKSEEFVLGDISIKLVRALNETAIVVVKSK